MKKNNRSASLVSRFAKAILGLTFVFLALFCSSLRAQEIYKVTDADIKVLGTSNLHDWSMEAKDVACTATFIFPSAGDGMPQSLTALKLTISVHNLQSGESSMDSRAYTALKADKNTTILYTSSSSTIALGQKNQFQVKSTGSMTIAGVSKPVVLIAACQVRPDGSIVCNGSEQLKMTDYQIKPPVFMLGALKTGDTLNINFSLTFKK